MEFESKSLVQYQEHIGNIVCVCKNYFTLNLLNTSALMLIFRHQWKDVTVLQVAQDS